MKAESVMTAEALKIAAAGLKGKQEMYFLISNQNTHGDESHWDVTITSYPEIVSREWRISPDLEIEGWGDFIKEAKKAQIKTVSVYLDKLEGKMTKVKLAKHFEVVDYVTAEDLI